MSPSLLTALHPVSWCALLRGHELRPSLGRFSLSFGARELTGDPVRTTINVIEPVAFVRVLKERLR